MKRVLNAGIGGRSFIIDEDAYQRLDRYLDRFRERTRMGVQAKDVMEDLEQRIAELFSESLKSDQEVVNLSLVNRVIGQLGMPDGTQDEDDFTSAGETAAPSQGRKLYRDPDSRVLGGVCGGLSHYLNTDLVLLRVLLFVAFFIGGVGFWLYIILWLVVPVADTAARKCEMRGIPATAENLRRYSNYK